MAKKNIWQYGDFYAKDQEYLDNPKFVWTVFAKLIKKHKNSKKLLWDIGCADASMLRYLEKIFSKWDFQGTDNNKFLLEFHINILGLCKASLLLQLSQKVLVYFCLTIIHL